MRLDRQTWEEIAVHARQEYPAECCGIVAEDDSGQFQVHPCENIQDKLHEKDPQTHPRTSREAYRMDDLQVHRIVSQTEKVGGRLMAFYHSHIDCDAYFSEEDHRAAMFMDEPAYPGVVYIVVSVVNGEMRGEKGFHWDRDAGAFVEMPLEIEG